ncbi:MAG: pilin [Patescibacteria group bacterium]
MSTFRHKRLILTAITVVALAALVIPAVTRAAESSSGFQIIPPECLGDQKNAECNLNSFVQLFINLAQVALKLLPYLAMIMMIWAGFNLIMAGGNPEKIQQGKKMITSVVVGVIIIIFLAWAFGNFIVFVLTGSTNIFPDYGTPFSKEWWGGGVANPHQPNAGCCYVEDYGCKEMTQTDCTAISGTYGGASVQFMGENQFCSEYPAVCKNYTIGCCVPDDTTDKTCYWPDSKTGCINWPTTYHSNTACNFLGQDCDPALIQGTSTASETGTGCCIQPNTCTTTTSANCPSGGTFKPGVSCTDETECIIGCCIGQSSCSDSKINCTSNIYVPQTCKEARDILGLCLTGCCIQDPGGNNNCYNNYTAGYCTTVGGIFNNDISCSQFTSCTDGCCQETCTDGNIDGSCANLTYDINNTCSANTSCAPVCCLYQNALTCSSAVSQQTCLPPNNQTILGGPGGACPTNAGQQCETGTCRNTTTGACVSPVARIACTGTFTAASSPPDPQCVTGCCVNPNNDLTCHESYTQAQCTLAGGTFSSGAACSTVGDCSGCCVELDNDYNCFEPLTRAKCSATFPVTAFRPGDRCINVVDPNNGQRACVQGCCVKTDIIDPGPPQIDLTTCTQWSTEIYCSMNGGTFYENDRACDNVQTSITCDLLVNNTPLP